MEIQPASNVDPPKEATSILTITNSNSKTKKHPCGNGSTRLSVLTLGRKVYEPSKDYNPRDDCSVVRGQHDDSGDDMEAFESVINSDGEINDIPDQSSSRGYDKESIFIKNELLHDTDDDAEAFGFELETNANGDSSLIRETYDGTVQANLSSLKSSTLMLKHETSKEAYQFDSGVLTSLDHFKKDNNFFPVNVVTSVIPDMFDEKFPKPIDQTGKFVCIWCKPKTRMDVNKTVYKNVYHLVKHYLRGHKDIPLKDYGIQCEHCSAYFFHERRLEMHLKASCHIKNKVKSPRSRLSKKLVVDTLMKLCPFCDIIFLSKKRYQKHLHLTSNGCIFADIEHPMSEWGVFDYMKCKFCHETFLFEVDYQQHLMPRSSHSKYSQTMGIFKCRNVSLQYFECSVCLAKYSNEISFFLHIYHDHTIDEFKFNCDRCNRSFRFKNNYEDHVAVMSNFPRCIDYDACRTIPIRKDHDNNIHNDREGGVGFHTCPHCSTVFMDKARLFYHIRNVHNLTPQWKCDDCKMTFITISDYENHITKWKCPFCLDVQIFPLKRQLKDHCFAKHRIVDDNEEERKTCGVCNAVLKNEFTFQVHMRELHGSDLKICPFCGETDDNRINMYKHIKAFHAYQPPSEKTFFCELCGNKASFIDKNRLARHIACVHKKAESTECDICHKSFAQKATMLRHRRIHLDIKPFKCGICGLSFTQKTGMRAHKARHYNKDGTLKTAEEIKTQVEIIKEQREKLSDPNLKASPKKRSRSRKHKKLVTCNRCGFQCVSAVELNAHVCEQNDKSNCEATTTATKIISSAFKQRKPRAKELFVCETCGDQFTNVTEYDSHACNYQEVSEDSTESEADEEKTNDYNQQVDDPVYKFKCDKCFKDFVTEQRFKAHRCLSNYRKVLKTSG